MFIQILISKKNSFFAGCTSCYFYYKHGPLARIEYGNDKVQGVDFAYTLQGWIKAVNSETLDSTRDIGNDGKPGNINENFASDAFGYSLNYYSGDYSAIDNSRNNCLASKTNMSNLATDAPSLYNGNINYMVTTITNPTSLQKLAQLTAYRYDQLNRLLQMRAFDTINLASNAWNNPGIYNGMYFNSFAYDANGGINKQVRKDESGTTINNLAYDRLTQDGNLKQNRLYHVNDSVADNAFADDIDDQGTFTNGATINSANNYSYDEIGNLTRNTQKEIDTIKWNVYGKVTEVIRTPSSTKKNLKFEYDPMGNRSAKHVYASDWTWEKSEYYVHDATGNVMSIYKYTANGTASFAQTERNIYGSSRIGADKAVTELISPPPQGSTYTHTLGDKQFEGTNHLGNILTTFTDKKIQHEDPNNLGTVLYYTAEIISSNDYYPFGVGMAARSFNTSSTRYGFNGKEKDDETETMDFGARLLDEDLGVWTALDPLAGNYSSWSPYNYSLNEPIGNIDPDGGWVEKKVVKYGKDNNGKEIQLKTISFRKVYRKEIFLTIHNAKLLNYDGQLEQQIPTNEGTIRFEKTKPSNEILEKTALSLQNELIDAVDNKTETDKMNRTVTTHLKFDEDIQVINNLKKVKTDGAKPDDLIILTKDVSQFEPGAAGFTQCGSNFVVMDITKTNANEIAFGQKEINAWVYPHEFSHQRTGIGNEGHGTGLLKISKLDGKPGFNELWRMGRRGNGGAPSELINKLKKDPVSTPKYKKPNN